MKHAPNLKVEKYRQRSGLSMHCAGTNAGAFEIPYKPGPVSELIAMDSSASSSVSSKIAAERCWLFVVASDGGGWDHVSVHAGGRCPTWQEMCFIKDLFFKDDEVVMQLHPAKKDYVNTHPHTLHLWRPQTEEEHGALVKEFGHDPLLDKSIPGPIPIPSKIMV